VASNPTLNLAYNLALTGSGAYSTVQSFQSGQFIAGAAGAVALAYGLSGLYKSAENTAQGGSSAAGGQQGRATSTATGAGAGVSPGGGFGNVAGKLWNLPNTAVGLAYGLVGGVIDRTLWLATLGYLDLGFSISIGNNAIQFQNHPLQQLFGGGAITLGNTISYGGLPTDPAPTSVAFATVPIGQHEIQHTFQGQVLGPLYLPANILGGTASLLGTPFTGLGPAGSPWHGPLNFMEGGPLSVPPRRWP
jgi:hypothetical protein